MPKSVKKTKPTAAKSASKPAAKPAKKPAKAAPAPVKKAKGHSSAKTAPATRPTAKKAEKVPDKSVKAKKASPSVAAPHKSSEKHSDKHSEKQAEKQAEKSSDKLLEKASKSSASAKPAAAAVAKPAKSAKADAKAKKPKRDEDEDDLMVSDEDLGAEEIPDLSEFEENEEPVVEDLDSDDETMPVVTSGSADDGEAVLTDAEGRPYCKVRDCDQIAAVEGYCRYHYLLLWKKIQVRRKILVDGKLERYVEELTSRYPDKFLEMIKRDLRTEKDFQSAIAELEIDESAGDNEFDDDNQGIEEVRGFGSEGGHGDDDDGGF